MKAPKLTPLQIAEALRYMDDPRPPSERRPLSFCADLADGMAEAKAALEEAARVASQKRADIDAITLRAYGHQLDIARADLRDTPEALARQNGRRSAAEDNDWEDFRIHLLGGRNTDCVMPVMTTSDAARLSSTPRATPHVFTRFMRFTEDPPKAELALASGRSAHTRIPPYRHFQAAMQAIRGCGDAALLVTWIELSARWLETVDPWEDRTRALVDAIAERFREFFKAGPGAFFYASVGNPCHAPARGDLVSRPHAAPALLAEVAMWSSPRKRCDYRTPCHKGSLEEMELALKKSLGLMAIKYHVNSRRDRIDSYCEFHAHRLLGLAQERFEQLGGVGKVTDLMEAIHLPPLRSRP